MAIGTGTGLFCQGEIFAARKLAAMKQKNAGQFQSSLQLSFQQAKVRIPFTWLKGAARRKTNAAGKMLTSKTSARFRAHDF